MRVYVAGCLEGDCHFKDGNQRALRRVAYIHRLLDEIGIGAERVEMHLMSAGMGERFAQVATAFTEKIRRLGPNPAKAAAGAPLQTGGLMKRIRKKGAWNHDHC